MFPVASVQEPVDLLVVLGPTASGKTRLGVQLARQTNAEIISADSRQVYRGMDIGTGKDLAEYGDVPYHLIDIREPCDEFSMFHFQRECLKAMDDIRSRARMPIIVGGTGLYLESVLKGYLLVEVPENPPLRSELDGLSLELLRKRFLGAAASVHNTTDLQDRGRLTRAIEIAEYGKGRKPEPLPAITPLIFGISHERAMLRRRITERLKERIANGMIEEVERLHTSGISWERLDYFGLEYRYIALYLRGELRRNDMFQKLNSAIHDFAKRQETWFRRMERNGVTINWLDGTHDPFSQALAILRQYTLFPHAH